MSAKTLTCSRETAKPRKGPIERRLKKAPKRALLGHIPLIKAYLTVNESAKEIG